MKAAVVLGPEQPPIYRDFQDPRPEPGAEVIHVAASALSNATRARASGRHYSLAAGFPLVPGIDGVGRTQGGRRVGFLLPEAPFGGMAEKTLVREGLCLPIPDALSDAAAAAMINPGQSPIGALRLRASLQPGETVMVNGATGVTGQVAVQIARHLGAGRVIATGRSREALTRLSDLGADETVELTADADAVKDALAAHFADGGVDIVLDYLSGAPAEMVLAQAALAHRSPKPLRYVLAGGAAGPSISVPTSVLGSSSLVLMGSGIGAVSVPEIVRSATEALQIAAAGDLRIDLTEVPLSRVAEAWITDFDRSRVVFTT